MAHYEVETDLLIHTKIKIVVEADTREAAIEAASDLLPSNCNPEKMRGWKATVDLTPPKGVSARFVKAHHFEQASGGERARRLAQNGM